MPTEKKKTSQKRTNINQNLEGEKKKGPRGVCKGVFTYVGPLLQKMGEI